jgi:hypothetical protein
MPLKFILVTFFLAFSSPADGRSINISARFDTTGIWIGEQTYFTLVINQPADMHLSVPEPNEFLSDQIEILNARPADTVITGSNLRITKSYRVTSFYEGSHYAEAIPIVFIIDGNEQVLHTVRARLDVGTPEIAEDEGIFDIKGPFGVSLSIFEILPWILLLAVVAAVAWYIVRYIRNRRIGKPVESRSVPGELPHVTALRELNRLKGEFLWKKGLIKEYYTRLTEIIRIYIERRFGIMAMELTSDETIRELGLKNIPGTRTVDMLRECFLIADLVKFAKAKPGEREHEECLVTAFSFVNDTSQPDLAGTAGDQKKMPVSAIGNNEFATSNNKDSLKNE